VLLCAAATPPQRERENERSNKNGENSVGRMARHINLPHPSKIKLRMKLRTILMPEDRTKIDLMQVRESICDKSVVDFKVTHRAVYPPVHSKRAQSYPFG